MPAEIRSVQECLGSNDPLSEDVFLYLLSYREEDSRVDFKLRFDGTDREWLEITKDVLAFSNSAGGYLVFGVENGTYAQVGLDPGDVSRLIDTNAVLQKLNRNVDPHIKTLRSKAFTHGGLHLAAWLIPGADRVIHIVSKDASYKYPSGSECFVLHKGTIWLRRSAGNHLADSSDIESIIARRIDGFREGLLSKIARVVESPPETEVVVLTPDTTDPDARTFRITDAPDALRIKGLNLGVVPQTEAQELASWIALSQRTPESVPEAPLLWKWYRERDTLAFDPAQCQHLAKYCILRAVPAFYWLRGTSGAEVRRILIEIVDTADRAGAASTVVGMAAALDLKTFESVVRRLGVRAELLAPRYRQPSGEDGERLLLGDVVEAVRRGHRNPDEEALRAIVIERLNDIASKAVKSARPPGVLDRQRALAFDCFLYRHQ